MLDSEARIWFFSDIHASNTCFRKFLNLVKHPTKPNVLIIGGDITGKYLMPIVEIGGKKLRYETENGVTIIREEQYTDTVKRLEDVGCYVYRCSPAEEKQLKLDKEEYKRVFQALTRRRLEEWVTLADEKLRDNSECQVFVNCGNDDPFFADEILDKSKTIVRPEGRIIDLPAGLKLLSTGYSNESPWPCPRDLPEDQLLERILAMTKELRGDEFSRAIFNFHCPPKNTFLDATIEIDPESKRKKAGAGGGAIGHVGSTAVRQAIENFQPIASLHGHIHTSNAKDRIGKTRCYNPGSDYASGHLQGVFLVASKNEITFDQLTHERDGGDGGQNAFISFLRNFRLGKALFPSNEGAPRSPRTKGDA